MKLYDYFLGELMSGKSTSLQRGDHIRVPIKVGKVDMGWFVPRYPHAKIYHHGIYIGKEEDGEEWVICLKSESPAQGKSRPLVLAMQGGTYTIVKVTLTDFAERTGSVIADIEKAPRSGFLNKMFIKPYEAEVVVQNAMNRLGETGTYSMAGPNWFDWMTGNAKYKINCEIFTTECETGDAHSEQVGDYIHSVSLLLAIGITVARTQNSIRKQE
jgi:hypothetical protein